MRKTRLTPADWARAALDAIGDGGVDAVAVETIAGQLGATKGSFYWHYKNRDALVEAALALWEESRTDAVIHELDREPDPARRLMVLMHGGIESGPAERAEIALLANPAHPAVVTAVRRVAKRRIRYIAGQLEALGWDSQQAQDRAVLLYYLYVGNMQVAHLAPGMATPEARRRRVELAFRALVAEPRGATL